MATLLLQNDYFYLLVVTYANVTYEIKACFVKHFGSIVTNYTSVFKYNFIISFWTAKHISVISLLMKPHISFLPANILLVHTFP